MKPIQPEIKKRKKIKHSRLPNGFGSITTLAGKRRNPFWARKTVGFDPETGYPIYQTIGYYPEWIDAFQALCEYNQTPYDIDLRNLTFKEVYERWSTRKFQEQKNGKPLSKQSIASYKVSFKHCAPLYDLKFSELNTIHLQKIIDTCPLGRESISNIKKLFSQLYQYGLEFNIVEKNYAQFVVLTKPASASKKIPFTKEEIEKVETKRGEEFADLALIMLYSGMRIAEIFQLNEFNVFLEQRYMRAGVKTESGKNRIIPIHSKIMDILERRLKNQSLFTYKNTDVARRDFKSQLGKLGISHLPHECRHTFISMADTVGMNDTALKKIVGHASPTITKSVYTHKQIDELVQEIEKIHY